ncbi:MAG TPA: HAD-IIIA family hydrolase [Thermoanaerobaculia bacterium]
MKRMNAERTTRNEPTIRLIISDIDGVWTDGKIIYVGDTREIKEFNVRDGLAVKLAQKAGIRVAVITSRRSKALERRCKELGVDDLVQSARDKLHETRALATKLGIALEEICYVGDDLPDLAPISVAGRSAAPSDSAPEVLRAVVWPLAAKGGCGAFRELVERLLKERGDWEKIVAEFHGAKITTPST